VLLARQGATILSPFCATTVPRFSKRVGRQRSPSCLCESVARLCGSLEHLLAASVHLVGHAAAVPERL